MLFEISYKKAAYLHSTNEVLAHYPELTPYSISSKNVLDEDGAEYLMVFANIQTMDEFNSLRHLCTLCISIEMHPDTNDIPFLEFVDKL